MSTFRIKVEETASAYYDVVAFCQDDALAKFEAWRKGDGETVREDLLATEHVMEHCTCLGMSDVSDIAIDPRETNARWRASNIELA